MKTLRPIHVVTCCVCGEEFDKVKMREIFTGRTRYICPECYDNGNRQMDARRDAWKDQERRHTTVYKANETGGTKE